MAAPHAGKRSGAAEAAPRGSDGFEVGRRGLPLPALLEVEAHALTFGKIADAGAFDGRNVHEDVLGAIIRLDEAEALCRVEPFNSADGHTVLPRSEEHTSELQ